MKVTCFSVFIRVALVFAPLLFADNPILTWIRTADPSPHVYEGRVYLYCSHDADNATSYSSMDRYHVFSSTDLVNWTDHGEVLNSSQVSWGNSGWMWAPDCAYKNGTYYFYFPHSDGVWRVGVATSANPQGPFTDIGHYITGANGMDPCCFIDDDGEAYLYWADVASGVCSGFYVAKLDTNMMSLAESPRAIDCSIAIPTDGEGVYMHKRNGVYYYSWTQYRSGGYYAMGSSPYGPFTYKGQMAPTGANAQDHHGILDYAGNTYYFYHVGNYNGGSCYRRNICIDFLYYNTDGTIQYVNETTQGVPAADGIERQPMLRNSSMRPVEMQVYNLRGQIVGKFMSTADNPLSWNGIGVRGQQLPNGVYVYRSLDAKDKAAKKLILLR